MSSETSSWTRILGPVWKLIAEVAKIKGTFQELLDRVLRKALVPLLVAVGCTGSPINQLMPPGVLRLAVTTSTQDSGLLDQLIPVFEQEHGVRVDVIAVGSGAALRLGESADVDVVLVHARAAEEEFMRQGHGTRREEVMYNSFLILGPQSDPAGIRDTVAARAMTKIAAGRHKFVSRGDHSGTHKRELALWDQNNISPMWEDYLETGQGMGASLIVADQVSGYIFCDQGTYLNFQAKLRLVPLVTSGEDLRNPYGVLAVNPAKSDRVDGALANAFIDFVISPQGQRIIGEYQINDQAPFHPLRLDDGT